MPIGIAIRIKATISCYLLLEIKTDERKIILHRSTAQINK